MRTQNSVNCDQTLYVVQFSKGGETAWIARLYFTLKIKLLKNATNLFQLQGSIVQVVWVG